MKYAILLNKRSTKFSVLIKLSWKWEQVSKRYKVDEYSMCFCMFMVDCIITISLYIYKYIKTCYLHHEHHSLDRSLRCGVWKLHMSIFITGNIYLRMKQNTFYLLLLVINQIYWMEVFKGNVLNNRKSWNVWRRVMLWVDSWNV